VRRRLPAEMSRAYLEIDIFLAASACKIVDIRGQILR
jgi:hypothetical protein